MHPRDHDRDGGLVSLRIAAGAYPLGARARSHWRARYASISVTKLDATPMEILGWFVSRWSIETTFQECRAHLGVETQRQWSDLAIARTTPALFGMFSLIALWVADPKIAVCLRPRPAACITNANLHSVMPSPPSEGCSGARRVFQCLGIPRTMWKFQPPSWKDLPTRYATPRKIPKVELKRIYTFCALLPNASARQQIGLLR